MVRETSFNDAFYFLKKERNWRLVGNRELYKIIRPWNYRGQQQLPDPAVATRGFSLRLIKLHKGVLARLIQVFTAVVNELIKRL